MLATTDLDKRSHSFSFSLVAITENDLKEIQKLLLDRVITLQNLLSFGVIEKPWIKDDVSTMCHNCHSQFTFLNRKQLYCGEELIVVTAGAVAACSAANALISM